MFTRIITTLALFGTLAAVPATAQKDNGSVSFAWGDTYKLPKGHEDLGFIGNAKEGYMQIGHDPHKSLSLQKFSPDMKLVDEKIIDLDKMPKDYTSEQFITIGDRYYWIFSTWENEKENLYVQEVSLKNNDFVGSAKEINSTSKLTGDLGKEGMFSLKVFNKYTYTFSGDGTKMLVQYRKKPEERNDKISHDKIGFLVLDADMHAMWSREIRMPYTEDKMDNEDYQVANNGSIYTLARIYNSKRADKKDPMFHFELLKWANDKTEVTKIPIRFTDKFVRHALLNEDKNGRIIVAGYYSSLLSQNQKTSVSYSFWGGTKMTTSVNGAFVIALAPGAEEFKDLFKGTYEFPADVMKEYESKRTKRKIDKKEEDGKAEQESLELSKFEIDDDGSIQLFGEERYYTSSSSGGTMGGFGGSAGGFGGSAGGFGSSRGTSSTHVHYDDILAININKDGNVKWIKKIPKAQEAISQSMGAGYSYSFVGNISSVPNHSAISHLSKGISFKEFTYNHNYYLFFFDNEKNLDITPDETPARHINNAGGILMVVKIDEAGNMQKSSVFDVREEKKKLIPTDFVSISENEIITRAWGKKGSQIALFTFGGK